MTPAEAAAALFHVMPRPLTISQLEEYGIEAAEANVSQIAREILSLNLYWVLAAVDAHIPMRYRAVIKETLFETIRNEWWDSGQLGTGSWSEYQPELTVRRERYAHLVDCEGISHSGICAEVAALIEDQGLISSDDCSKMLILLIDYAPAAQYGQLLEQIG
jgi:hypothetical protein